MQDALPNAQGSDSGIVVGHELSDDAAVVRLPGDDQRGLVLTTDFISPIVDDPETFGAIAATNALSDIYAMGGRPLYALNVVAFPQDKLPLSLLSRIMAGAAQACLRVGVPIVGGHSVRNEDIKFGLAVTGEVALDAVLSNAGAKAGQALVLSKALGTGIVGTAIKRQLASASQAAAAVASMCQMNDRALAVGRAAGVTACTDITGFGLLAHLRNILKARELAARLELSQLPVLEGALELAAAGHVPGGTRSNLAHVEQSLQLCLPEGAEGELRTLLAADAQTSGGLLLCVPSERADECVGELVKSGHRAARIGSLLQPSTRLPKGHCELCW